MILFLNAVGLTSLFLSGPIPGGESTTPRTAKEALQPFNALIGEWRGTGTPVGSRDEQQKGFWLESLSWQWQFKGSDAWLALTIDKGKHFKGGVLRYLPAKDAFELTLTTLSKESLSFTGVHKGKTLALERDVDGETHRLVFTLLHSNRFLYHHDVKQAGKTFFSKKYSVGATKEGEAFAAGDGRPECIVSGGLGTSAVSYMGKTYYVCCSGCRAEFLDNPEKYIKESKEKKTSKKP